MKNTTNLSTTVIDIALRASAVFILLFWCFAIIKPFILMLLWGGIIAISLQPVTLWVSQKLKLSSAKASSLLCVFALLLLIGPVIGLSTGLYSNSVDLLTEYQTGSFSIPEPNQSIKNWPLIGEQIYAFGLKAATNLTGLISQYSEEIKVVTSKLASLLGSVGGGIIQFIISVIIAGGFMANANKCGRFCELAASRLAGQQGPQLIQLSKTTVRSVVQGVIGVALIQSLLAGLGMLVAGVPLAGLWMLLVLLVAIIQLPPILALLPVILYVFHVDSSLIAIVFLIWCIGVSASDAILKPIMLSRGSQTPMLIILLGALGGMAMSGIIGLFVGAVILSLTYQLFSAWLDNESTDSETYK